MHSHFDKFCFNLFMNRMSQMLLILLRSALLLTFRMAVAVRISWKVQLEQQQEENFRVAIYRFELYQEAIHSVCIALVVFTSAEQL